MHDMMRENFTHIWVSIRSDHLIIYLTERPFAIDEITRFRTGWTIKILQLFPGQHLWGIALKPVLTEGTEFRFITPRYITQRNQTYYIEFEHNSNHYQELCILGRETKPNYGKIYDEQ